MTAAKRDGRTGKISKPETDSEEPAAEMLARLKINGAELDAKRFDPLIYQIPKLVPEGLGMLVGPPKKGKSFLVLDLALSVADGTKALCSIPVTKHPVLYLALEDGERRLQDRSRLLLEGDSIPPGIDFVTKAKPAEAIMMIEAFMSEHRDERPFAIVDTFAKVKRQKRPGEESYLVDYEAGERLKKLTEIAAGSTLLVVHHSRKAEATDFIDAASGTYGLAGSVDFVMVLNRKRLEDDAVLSITGRDVVEAEYALTAKDGYMWKLDGGDLRAAVETVAQRRVEAKMGDRKYDAYNYVCNCAEPVAPADVAKALGLDTDTTGKYLRRLVADGALTKAGRGKYMRASNVIPLRPKQ